MIKEDSPGKIKTLIWNMKEELSGFVEFFGSLLYKKKILKMDWNLRGSPI